ncbi:MAG: response regulator [Elusimicrobiota bacterium]|nr:response regulator [Elusimicrobiota bacterium]
MAEPAPLMILVVDDDKNQRSMLGFALRDRGYEVAAVENGAQALELAKAKVFAAAVCDIMMPGVNGVDTLKQLKALQPRLPVIMATAYATNALASASMKNGAFGYIAKPYELKELFSILERAVPPGGRQGP